MTDKKKSKQKKEIVEEPIIDKSRESLKKLISKGKKKVRCCRGKQAEALHFVEIMALNRGPVTKQSLP